MGGPGSGSRTGPKATGFRQKMRDIALLPTVLDKILKHAQEDPEFALRVAEHGFGRPPQALDIRASNVDPNEQLAYRASLEGEGGDLIPAEATGVPAPNDALRLPSGYDDFSPSAGQDDDIGVVAPGGGVVGRREGAMAELVDSPDV